MKNIIELRDENVFRKVAYKKPESFEDRVVVKAILLDPKNIAQNSTSKNSQKIGFVTNDVSGGISFAGGGADSGDLEKEIIREVLEETSLKVKVIKKFGTSVGYRNKIVKKYVEYFYICEVTGKSSKDRREEDEKEVNMRVVFLKKEVAFHRMELQKGAVECGVWDMYYHSCFNILRDFEVLKKYLGK